ncbi:hypothetical protein M8818_001488 [Zalaria obscura]|uniref:Uncharacterized protein n=1 Tax=Zalaria obscura TaxID=2024903 RepID=A0ACC3SKH7_9PEZI
MLPQVDPPVLANNPRFETLWKDLCSSKLTADNSSQSVHVPTRKQHEATKKNLHDVRATVAKRDILKDALRHVAYNGKYLPQEIEDAVRIVVSDIEGEFTADDQDIVQEEKEYFLSNMDKVAPQVSAQLHRNLTQLALLSGPDATSSLPETLANLNNSVTNAHATLSRSRIALANESTALLATYRTLLETTIRHLEQTLHGSVARGTRTQAEHLAAVAEAMGKKLRLLEMQVVRETYSPEVTEALRVREEALKREASGCRRRIRDMEERLEGYGSVRGMGQIVDAWVDVRREIERVGEEVARLEGR